MKSLSRRQAEALGGPTDDDDPRIPRLPNGGIDGALAGRGWAYAPGRVAVDGLASKVAGLRTRAAVIRAQLAPLQAMAAAKLGGVLDAMVMSAQARHRLAAALEAQLADKAAPVPQAIVNARRVADAYVLERGAASGHEYGAVIDAAGKIIHRTTSRQPSSINVDLLRFPAGPLEFVHNHPRGSSLSSADLLAAQYYSAGRGDPVTVTAVTKFGSRFSGRVVVDLSDVRLAAELRRVFVESKNAVIAARGAATWGDDEMNFLHSHLANKVLADAGWIMYSAELGDRDAAALQAVPPELIEWMLRATAHLLSLAL